MSSKIDPKLLEILVEPGTRSPLEYDVKRQVLISTQTKLAYPIRDGIPIMLAEEAIHVDDLPKSETSAAEINE